MKKYNACADQHRPSILNVIVLALILFVTTLYVSPHASAATMKGNYHVIVNGRSYHMQEARDGSKLNENNFGSGFQYDFSRSYGARWVPFITASAFSDSFNNLSYYAGGGEMRRFYFSKGWHADVGYVGFIMARKDINDYRPFPGVLPVASIGTRDVSVNITYVPDVNDQIAELLFFQLKVSM